MKQLLGFFFTLIGKAEKQYQKMNLPNYSDLIIQQFKIVLKKLSSIHQSD